MATKKKATTAATETTVQQAPEFDKSQIVSSKKFSDCRDLVDALLLDGKKYTTEQVEKMIEDYKKGQVK